MINVEMNEEKKTSLAYMMLIYVSSVSATALTCTRVYLAAKMGRGSRAYFDAQINAWAKRLVDVVRLQFTVVNQHGFRLESGKPTVLMCNHSSLYDIPLTFCAMKGSIRMLTKKELFRIPIFGIGMRASEFISIDRQNHERALRDLEVAKARMKSGIAVWISPEGTRSPNGELLPFKKGGFHLAIETGAQIVPIGIVGIHRVLPKGCFRMMLNIPVLFKIGKPIDASQYGVDSIDELMAEVRGSMVSLLGRNEKSQPFPLTSDQEKVCPEVDRV